MKTQDYEKRIVELERQVEALLRCLSESNDAIKMTAAATMSVVRRNPGREQLQDAINKVS